MIVEGVAVVATPLFVCWGGRKCRSFDSAQDDGIESGADDGLKRSGSDIAGNGVSGTDGDAS